MDFYELAKKRRSIRQYENEEIGKDTILKILDAGRYAPSAYREEPWHYVVVQDKAKLKEIADITDYGKFIKNAGALVAVYCEEGKYYLEDGCAAVQNILLAIQDAGLGSCWVAGDKKKYVEEINKYFNAPENMKLIALLPIGKPVGEPKERKRKELEEIVHWNSF